MKIRTDIHRRTRLLLWLRIACLVGLCGVSACQDTERAIAASDALQGAADASPTLRDRFE